VVLAVVAEKMLVLLELAALAQLVRVLQVEQEVQVLHIVVAEAVAQALLAHLALFLAMVAQVLLG
jgi:hypothetical protein